jgi:hypothetical protein
MAYFLSKVRKLSPHLQRFKLKFNKFRADKIITNEIKKLSF